ncbi:MAG: XdhC family protein [Methylobacillus sp.]|jgi:xanthine dehydrogenase accessory factor|nr:XdhC family protein [Methylobacillus sp.]
MDSVDLSVLKTLEAWRDEAHPAWLVTVVETFGSSPRPPGAMLALRADGRAVGSVSGGCIEDDLVRRAQSGELLNDRAEKVVYGVTAEEARRFGLPCGGTLRLVIEPVRGAAWVGELLERIRAHRITRRCLQLATLQVALSDADKREAEVAYDDDTLVTLHGPRWRLLIIGAGQTSTYLAQMAQALDYEVTVCDPREEMRAAWNVPETQLLATMPDDAVLAFAADARTAIIALTHDPKLDDMALLEALKSDAFYVGALGSKANNAKRRERLALFDLAPGEIGRLHGPVGLAIGSRTPPEIAVAILAQLIQVRSGRTQEQDQRAACAV